MFRQQLTDRGWQYAVAVEGSVSAHDGDAVPQAQPYGGRGQPPKPAYPRPPATLRTLALAHAGQVRPVTWRQGTRTTRDNPGAAMASCFLAIRVRPAGKPIPRQADRSLPACWLLAEWPPEADEPSGYWLSTLPEDTPIDELVRLAKIRWRVEHDYRELKTGLGLDHFEGRSFDGWHRHVTRAVLARLLDTPALQHLYDDHRAARRPVRAPQMIMSRIVRFSTPRRGLDVPTSWRAVIAKTVGHRRAGSIHPARRSASGANRIPPLAASGIPHELVAAVGRAVAAVSSLRSRAGAVRIGSDLDSRRVP